MLTELLLNENELEDAAMVFIGRGAAILSRSSDVMLLVHRIGTLNYSTQAVARRKQHQRAGRSSTRRLELALCVQDVQVCLSVQLVSDTTSHFE